MTSAVLYPAAKKAEDKVVSLVLVVLLAPFSVLAYGAMTLGMLRRREDCGPWLYRERPISGGREFDLLKLRTLRRDVLERAQGVEAYARLYEAEA